MARHRDRKGKRASAPEVPANDPEREPTPGLTEALPAPAAAAAEPAHQNGRAAAATVAAAPAQVREGERSTLLDELERDLDRILFRIMSEGGMPEIERQIRLCRRLLILGNPE
jgi:hypothetical protein